MTSALQLPEYFGSTRVVTDADIVAAHSTDMSVGAAVGRALALVRPTTVDDVQHIMRWAHAHKVPVVPQGARTGLAGGAHATDGCLLVDVSAMNKILEVDPDNLTVTVQPGVINQDLKNHLADYGLAYPPDPGSVAISTIGGNIATNAGGMCCVHFGVTGHFVRSLSVVLADGTLTRVGHRTAKGVAGLDLASLFVGSEGTLGIIVEATLKVIPAPPAPVTVVATFDSVVAAARTVSQAMSSGVTPRLCELIDGFTIGLLNDFGHFGLDPQAGALLIVQLNTDNEAQQFSQTAQAQGASDVVESSHPDDADAMIAARRAVQPSFEKYMQSHGGGQIIEDICVPRSALPSFYEEIDRIKQETGVAMSVVAHAGDGNTHPTLFFDPSCPQSVSAAHSAFEKVMKAGLDVGGTITGEHGVGLLKAPYLALELDEGNRLLHRKIKEAVDPFNILNPGKGLPLDS